MIGKKITGKKIIVGLSGGVDSAVSAYLLQKQGFEVKGGFMKNYVSKSGECTTYKDAQEAIKVAKFLDIELLVFDFQKEYNDTIINYIYDGYKMGITPNPDILCNNLIKFKLFLDKSIEMGFDYIATGHYARIEKDIIKNNYKLLKGLDNKKDQSYFLSGLNQYQLSKSLFPLGELCKVKVRDIAKQIGLPNADRKDSQGLCFVGNIPIKKFLQQKLPIQKGDILDCNGKKVGDHDGAWFFTIGQKQGLGLNFKAYVTQINVKQNTITIGEKESQKLLKNKISIINWHRINEIYSSDVEVQAKIRYRQDVQNAKIIYYKNEFFIEFDDLQWGVASGQNIVAYIADECIGNGIIA